MKLPTNPAAPRAPAVLDARPGLERELADLRLQVAERALAAYEGGAAERAKLGALVSAIETITFQLEANALAHGLAVRLDREAVAAWRQQIEANPTEATVGISRTKCRGMCTEAHGCVITGEACAHPITVGGVGPRHQGNRAVRALFAAAARKLDIPGYRQEDAA
ncbi:hypothetical protein [Bradyrhizobium sp. WSM1253]|uniref:hypothetical protein n=1 Tax=Bradyrhizobium sp. WSM1253 TaxID=319003 RepID=UPI00025D1850|nr:hypothetical protein [Bradyrhizobium sp. WSM1253]EIG56079.1 hypothetical protein Bra1253DRAFT_00687 [Bradyrhizobium sp. WSM1253]